MKKRFLILFLLIFMICSTAAANTIKEYDTIGGVNCKARQNLLTYLFMGIDNAGAVDDAVKGGENPGQCDVLMLLVIDKAANTYAVININRNTITDVHFISDLDGTDLGAFKSQISLAHSNGDGKHQSCENTVRAVSDLLLGVRVDHYAAVNMDAIEVINHAVGGVEVKIEDDFSAMDSSMVMGETILLTDRQAVTYLRGRTSVGDGTNTSRMRRQKTYLHAYKPLFIEKYENNYRFPLQLVRDLDAYMVTDMTDKDFSYIAKALAKNTDLGIFELEGTTTLDEDDWAQFVPDQEHLTNLVIDVFYKRIEE